MDKRTNQNITTETDHSLNNVNPNPFSEDVITKSKEEGGGNDISIEAIADWTFKTLTAVAAGATIYSIFKKDDTAS